MTAVAQQVSSDFPSTRNEKSQEFTNGVTKAPRNVAWYQENLNKVPDTIKEVFLNYSKIPEEKLLDHIHEVRDKAWDILPYPCIGVFRFLDCPANLAPIYPEVLERVRNGETFLDLGCCFGQDIRKLVYDGAPSENLVGVDTEARFHDLGYELFNDRDTLKSKFYTQDVFDENFLQDWHGKVDIIFLGSFLHLFSYEQQKVVLGQLMKLLRKRKGSLVFGRHMGLAENGGRTRTNALGWDLYHHSLETIHQLWDEAPEGKWDVDAELVSYQSEGWDGKKKNWQGDEVKQMLFSAKRL